MLSSAAFFSDSSALASRWWPSIKRFLDIVVAFTALLVAMPLIVLVAALILVFMGRPVLFRQTRPGLHGSLFTLTKFRTMRSGSGTDAERLGRLGRFLRSTSLDELPELWNIVRGDMTLVGPRPLLVEYLPLYNERQARRHDVRPGLTGLAQVSGRNALDWDSRLELDVQYVERMSPVLDAQILVRTVLAVVGRSGVSAEGHVTVEHFRGSDTQVEVTG
jgi:lipopolysaccharide/colanic/teichoic acid biosynthesis glycosyltransferase